MSRQDPDENIPLDPITKEPKYYVVSASQLKTWWSCRRKWGWEKLARLRGPAGRGAGLGDLTHKQLEAYLEEDKSLDFTIKDAYGTYPAEVAAPGLQYIPKPKSPGLHVEKYFKFPVPVPEGHPPIFVRGYKDYFVEPQHREDGLPHVGDHKTTGNWQYALTADDLQNDVQAIIYAWDELCKHPDAPAVTLKWTYYGTKKPHRAQPVCATVTREHVTQLVEEVFVGARELVTTYRSRTEVLALPYNAEMCGAYNGCPYAGNCNLSPRERRPRNTMSNTVSTSNLVERMNARKAEMTGQPAAPAPAAGMSLLQAKIAAVKAARAAQQATPPETEEQARAHFAMIDKAAGAAPTAEEVVASIGEGIAAALLAWADPSKPDPLTGRSPMPASDQPINCPEDYQPPPATASTPVEVAPELTPAPVAAKQGRPKGSKNSTAKAAIEGIDPALLNEFLTTATAYMKRFLALQGDSK